MKLIWFKSNSSTIKIKACKLLLEPIDPTFEVAKFVYISDVVESFGNLVFERVKKLAFPKLDDKKLA